MSSPTPLAVSKMNDSEDWAVFYPDVRAAGSLNEALSTLLAGMGSALVATPLGATMAPFESTLALFESKPRNAQVALAARERLFLVDVWSRGVQLASGRTDDLGQVALAIDTWLADPEMKTGDFAARFPWSRAGKNARMFEEGREVDWKWEAMLRNLPDYDPAVREIISRAAQEPRLRMLFPYMSMAALCFSRCTGYPYSGDTPRIWPEGDGQYVVLERRQFMNWNWRRKIGRGDANAAVRLAVAHLPPGCGPARPGTADDL